MKTTISFRVSCLKLWGRVSEQQQVNDRHIAGHYGQMDGEAVLAVFG